MKQRLKELHPKLVAELIGSVRCEHEEGCNCLYCKSLRMYVYNKLELHHRKREERLYYGPRWFANMDPRPKEEADKEIERRIRYYRRVKNKARDWMPFVDID